MNHLTNEEIDATYQRIDKAKSLSKGESAHNYNGFAAEQIEKLFSERSRLREQVKELLAACKRVIGSRMFSIDHEINRMPGTEQTDLRDQLVSAVASVEADKQGGQ